MSWAPRRPGRCGRHALATLAGSSIDGHAPDATAPAAALHGPGPTTMIRPPVEPRPPGPVAPPTGVTMTAPTVPAASAGAFPAGDPNRRLVAQASWTLYDFANTMFSFAVVSGVIGLYLVEPTSSASATATSSCRSRSSSASASTPLSRRSSGRSGPRRPPDAVPARLHRPVHRRDVLHRRRAARHRRALFIVANFAYQAALIYYDATLKTVSTPESRGRLSGIGRGSATGDRVHRPAIFFLDMPVEDRFRLTSILVPRVRDPDLLVRPGAAAPRPGAGHVVHPPDCSGRPSARSPTPARSPACGGS